MLHSNNQTKFATLNNDYSMINSSSRSVFIVEHRGESEIYHRHAVLN